MQIKTCSRCKLNKPVTAFYKDARLKSGLASRCKECSAFLAKEWYANNTKHTRAMNKIWQANNREKYRNNEQKRRALKQKAGKFVIKHKELLALYRSPCFYCGSVSQITIDHLIPLSRGGRHSVGNLVSACMKCNQSKHKKTVTEWRKRCKKFQ